MEGEEGERKIAYLLITSHGNIQLKGEKLYQYVSPE